MIRPRTLSSATVRSQAAPAYDDERGQRDDCEQRQLDDGAQRERRTEQQRLDLVGEAEETPATLGVRAERRQ